jgi:hypothetical protein
LREPDAFPAPPDPRVPKTKVRHKESPYWPRAHRAGRELHDRTGHPPHRRLARRRRWRQACLQQQETQSLEWRLPRRDEKTITAIVLHQEVEHVGETTRGRISSIVSRRSPSTRPHSATRRNRDCGAEPEEVTMSAANEESILCADEDGDAHWCSVPLELWSICLSHSGRSTPR